VILSGHPRRVPTASQCTLFLRALLDPGLKVEEVPSLLERRRSNRRHRKGQSLVPMAAADQVVRGLQNIFAEAAIGDQAAYGLLLRLLHEFHLVMTTR